MKSINTILVANRGEIALRVMRTCKRLGIDTVAVFSDADANAPFVRAADKAVRIGPAPSSESYLRIDRILAAAKATGADAIHPGYGFLAENAEFSAACTEAGVIFIGPTPDAISLLGSKQASKRKVADAGVPVIPGYDGDDQDPAVLSAKAGEIGFPVLIKASAGGGGKGMRVAREASEVAEAIAAAKREAASSFGDDTLLIERYVDHPRHVEIQILGDQHGTVIHLGERECSIQRRHQKIIEETPSVALDQALRERMGSAAVKVGEAVGYQNAGTVEFILAPDGEFYFLEVNTRLQVEHPITEMVTGLDLVHEQIRVACGEPLRLRQSDIQMNGAAIECRLYAEDADDSDGGFLPATGRVVDWHIPAVDGLRVDSGIEAGDEIGIHYDPMIAKVVVHGEDRADAIRRMIYALERLALQGITNNREFLIRVLDHPAYRAGDIDTHFLQTHVKELAATPVGEAELRRGAIAATLSDHERRREHRIALPHIPSGWRNNRNLDEWVEYRCGETELRIEYHAVGAAAFCFGDERVHLVSLDGPALVFEDGDGIRRSYRVVRDGTRWLVHSLEATVVLEQLPRFPEPEVATVAGACTAPMPGTIIKVLVSEGQTVAAGDTLVILEAMKMEHAVKAGEDGVISAISVSEGDQVDADDLLVVVSASD